MNKAVAVLAVIVIFILIFIALGPFFILSEGEQAVVTRFGAIRNSHTEAGLKFKMPVIDSVEKYPRRILSWDGEPTRVPTSENQFIWIDTTARWKITDATRYYESVKTLRQGYARLDEIIESSIRTVIAANPLFEAVRNSNVINEIDRRSTQIPDVEQITDLLESGIMTLSAASVQDNVIYPTIQRGRNELSNQMFRNTEARMDQYGIELIDIVVRQIRYSEDLTQSVYNRMIVERNQKAQEFRSLGEGAKAEWLGRVENEQMGRMSEAYRRSQEIMAEGDAQAARVYAEAYGLNPKFAIFWRSLESYRKTMDKFSKTLTTDPEYFRYLYQSSSR